MPFRRSYLFIVSVILAFLIQIWIDGSFYEYVAVLLLFFYLLSFIDSIGHDYQVVQIPILFSVFQLLIMPMVVYRIYNENDTVISFFYNMSISESDYYSFMVPAVLAMIVGMEFSFMQAKTRQNILHNTFKNTRSYLKGKSIIGIVLMSIGLVSGFVSAFLPAGFDYLGYLLGKLLFVGIFYVLCSDIRNKQLYIILGLASLIIQTIINGMFGELIYTSLLGLLLLIIGKKKPFHYKLILVIVGAVFILILQSIKAEYRSYAWYGEGVSDQSNTEVFFNLIGDRISNPENFFDKEKNFSLVVRFNQGMLQAKVMNYVPSVRPYAGGETIYKSLLASFVPRFLWPDKPMAGGLWNMEYFTGLIISGYSMNIGPFGEAYGNFGSFGGICFMLFYGMFFNLAFYYILRIAKNKPTIILWVPILFINSIQIETDILMTVNSIIKNGIFIAFCYWVADRFMRIKI